MAKSKGEPKPKVAILPRSAKARDVLQAHVWHSKSTSSSSSSSRNGLGETGKEDDVSSGNKGEQIVLLSVDSSSLSDSTGVEATPGAYSNVELGLKELSEKGDQGAGLNGDITPSEGGRETPSGSEFVEETPGMYSGSQIEVTLVEKQPSPGEKGVGTVGGEIVSEVQAAGASSSMSCKSWKDLFLAKVNPNFKLTYHAPILENGERVVAPPPEVFQRGALQWQYTLVGQFLGVASSFREVKGFVEGQWKKFGPVRISSTDKGVYLFRFSSEDYCLGALEKIWSLGNKPLILKMWEPGMEIEAFRLDEFPMWIRLKDVPAELWSVEGLGSSPVEWDARCSLKDGLLNKKGSVSRRCL